MSQNMEAPAEARLISRSETMAVFRNAGRMTLSLLAGAQTMLIGIGVYTASTSPEQEVAAAPCVSEGTLCLSEDDPANAPIGIVLPSEPVIAYIEPLPPEPAPEVVPPPTALAPTTTQPQESCEDIVASVTARVPVPSGWNFICTDLSLDVDGIASPRENTITLYFGDQGDTNADKRYTTAHEIGHAWTDELGYLNDGFSPQEIEDIADHFALAFGYDQKDSRGTRAGAVAVCRMFADRGAHIC